MDGTSFRRTGGWLGAAGSAGIEFTQAGLSFVVEDEGVSCAFDGGDFALKVDGEQKLWPTRVVLGPGSVVDILPGGAGNYGYIRFDREIDVPVVMGSRATSSIAGLGGFEGRALGRGDVLRFGAALAPGRAPHPHAAEVAARPIRVTWGIHADGFDPAIRQRFAEESFVISNQIDRMGVRLTDRSNVFAGASILSLVSDAVVPGDIQILGDGTPIVLMRDHQPTGGYPRIATVVTADFDRLAQMRPGSEVRFEPITVAHAQELMR